MGSAELLVILVMILVLAALSLAIVKLNRLPKLRCDECGEEKGSNDYCDDCIDWRAYP